ncbi:kinetochore protein mis14 [Aspergillus lentulus]|nr:kinetochore protein mis14 [Aspergillus lentulus]
MSAPHYRKIELQSPADFTYLYANTVALSRQKLDLHLPPSANTSDGPDPMRERVKELVDQYINQTFTTASASISINGLDSSSSQFPFPAAFTQPTETIEYEPYDTELAARVTSLYAQLESLTTTVAQLRQDAPARAAKAYAEQLRKAIEEDEEDMEKDADVDGEYGHENRNEDGDGEGEEDVPMPDADPRDTMTQDGSRKLRRRPLKLKSARWNLQIPLGSEHEAERWRSGEMAEVYDDALRTLLRLQGEAVPGEQVESGPDGDALSSTLGKAERAGRAAEVVEKM